MMIKGQEVSALALRAASAHSTLRRAVIAAAALALLMAMSVPAAMAQTRGSGTSTGSTSVSPSRVVPSPSSITGKEKTEDPIIVSNFGGIVGGNFEVFNSPTAGGNIPPSQLVAGSHTALIGPQGVASSPFDTDTYVVASAIPAVFGFSPGDNGNDGTEFPLGCLPGLFTPPCVVGFDSPGGVAFGVTNITIPEAVATGSDPLIPRMWITNNLPVIHKALPPTSSNICAVGTLNAYVPDSALLGLLNSPPNPDHIFAINDGKGTLQPSTIGGCNTLLILPEGVAVDSISRSLDTTATQLVPRQQGLIFAVSNSGPWMTIYNPQLLLFPGHDGYGNTIPAGAFGVPGAIAGLFPWGVLQGAGKLISPEFVALDVEDELAYVTDKGDNSINVIAYDPVDFFPLVATTFMGKIIGTNTALRTPLGIGVGAGLDDLYVANTTANKVSFFDLAAPVSGTQNISPQVVITGTMTKINQPIGISMSCFADFEAPQCLAGCPFPETFNPFTGECQGAPVL